MTSVRNCKLFQKLVMTAALLGASAVSGHAQNAYQGKFTLAAEAYWGGVALPAGDYTFVLPSKSAPYRLYVHGEGVGAIITAAGVDDKVDSGHTQLILVNTMDGYAIQAFEAPDLGLTFVYPTTTNNRRDRTQSGQKTVTPAMPKSQLSGSKTSVEVQNTTH